MNIRNTTLLSTSLAACVMSAMIPGASAADAASWSVDVSKSTVGFSGTQTGARFEGRFSRYETAIVLDPDNPEGARISATVDVGSAATGDAQRDAALPKKEWFDAADFPQSTFVSNTVRKVGDGSYAADGTLTLRGVSKPLTLPFTLEISCDTAHAKGHLDLTRDAFGVGQGPWATGQWVALEVGIDFDLVALRSK